VGRPEQYGLDGQYRHFCQLANKVKSFHHRGTEYTEKGFVLLATSVFSVPLW